LAAEAQVTGILDELAKAQDRVAGGIVVAMHEEQDLLLAWRPLGQFTVHLGNEGRVATVNSRIDDCELCTGIRRQSLGTFKLSGDMVGWNGHVDRGKPKFRRALT
jgi:hypothetical protein